MSSLQFTIGQSKDESKKNAMEVIEGYYKEIAAKSEKVLAVATDCFDKIRTNRPNGRVSQKDLVNAIRFSGAFYDLDDTTIEQILKEGGYQGIGDKAFHGKGGSGILRPGEARPVKGAAAETAASTSAPDNGKAGAAAAAPKGGAPRSARA